MQISDHAVVDPSAEVGEDVAIGPFTIVHANVRIGPGTVIGSHCEIGYPGPGKGLGPLRLGETSVVRSHSVLYEGSSFGSRLETGHRVTLREGLDVGENLRVGTLSDLQGDARIGDYVRLHSNVHIGKGSTVGDFVWVFPYVVFTNDPHPPSELIEGPTVEDFAIVATMSVLLPGVRIGRGALVGAGSVVNRDVAPEDLVVGSPAKRARSVTEIRLRDEERTPAYPWTARFHRGYPDHVVAGWLDHGTQRVDGGNER